METEAPIRHTEALYSLAPTSRRRSYRCESSKVEVTSRLTVGRSVCLGIEHPCGTCDQILLPVGVLLSEISGLVSMGALSDERTGLQFAV
jgi:hypothetical protein